MSTLGELQAEFNSLQLEVLQNLNHMASRGGRGIQSAQAEANNRTLFEQMVAINDQIRVHPSGTWRDIKRQEKAHRVDRLTEHQRARDQL